MKVYVYCDEVYPVYGIDDETEEIEVPDGLVEEYKSVEKMWLKVQEELEKYYGG